MTRPAPLALFRETLASPIGEIVILTDRDGRLRALDFTDYAERMTRLLKRHYRVGGWTIADPPRATAAFNAVSRYFGGELRAIEALETTTAGTPFQQSVWAALRAVPPGAPESYGALARRIGRDSAVRAVGLANGANPIAIVAPCHRIVGTSGALTGYAGGVERKRWLLDHEARHSQAS